jgi:hypothetical protein
VAGILYAGAQKWPRNSRFAAFCSGVLLRLISNPSIASVGHFWEFWDRPSRLDYYMATAGLLEHGLGQDNSAWHVHGPKHLSGRADTPQQSK